jgi:hypothetical protein
LEAGVFFSFRNKYTGIWQLSRGHLPRAHATPFYTSYFEVTCHL